MPLRLEGEATAVAQGGGLVDPAVDSIEVITTPRSIPDEFVVDVTAMQMDTVIRLSDIPMPAGVTATGDPDSPVVTVLTMRAEVAEIEAADAEVAEEQAEETAEGEGWRGRRGGWRRRCRGRRRRGVRRKTPFDWLIVGLGNPGKEYARTRHNVGQEVVAELARRRGDTLKSGRDNALVAECRIGTGDAEARAVLAFPLTYMNESGQAVRALVRRYGIEDPTRIVIVQDELDLPPTVVRVKNGGGLAGHNGLRSVVAHLGTQDFLRVRIGVGKPPSKEARRRPRAVTDAGEAARAVRRRRPGGRRRGRADRHRGRRRRDAALQRARCRRVTPSAGWPSGSTPASPASACSAASRVIRAWSASTSPAPCCTRRTPAASTC